MVAATPIEVHSDASRAPADDNAARLLAATAGVAADLHPRHAPAHVALDSLLDRDLGIDSLGRMELLARLERAFGVTLPDQALANADTPRDLLRAILGALGDSAGAATQASAEPWSERSAAGLRTAAAIPESVPTLVDVLEWHAAAHGEREHLRVYRAEHDVDVLGYAELRDAARRIAAGLQGYDIAPGESVLIMLPTGREYFETFLGVLTAGAVPVPIYPPGRPSQLEEHLRRHAAIAANCGAVLMVTTAAGVPFARLMRGQAGALRAAATPAELASRGAAIDAPFNRPAFGADDVAFLQYTSGSTGAPKGVVLTHRNVLSNIRAMRRALAVTPQDVFVSWLPLYHDMGLIGTWLGALYTGASLVILSPLAFIARPQRWLQAIHRHRATLSAAPNFAYELCLKRLDDADLAGVDLSSWRAALNGAEAVSPATIERFIARFAAHGFRAEALMPVYGLAENAVGLAFPPPGRAPVIDRIRRRALAEHGRAEPASPEESDALRFVACGHPLPEHEIRIVDESGRELPERSEGRLQFRGPSSTSGYFRNPEQTRELFDGAWLNSGDMAYIAAGDVYITGRRKDIVIRAGRNIYPEEIEEAVGDIGGIRKGNVAAFGSVDRETGTERLIVLAETRSREASARERQRTEIAARVADLSGLPPDEIVLAPPHTVLKTSSGKVRRSACRQLFEQGGLGGAPSAVWWQVTRIALAGLGTRLRRALRDLGAVLYAGYAWSVFGLAAALLWGALVILPSPRWRWAAIRTTVRTVTRLLRIPLSVQGLEHLPASDQACIFVANHQSYLDGLVLAGTLARPLVIVAKAELRRIHAVRILLDRIGAAYAERFDLQLGAEDARRIAARTRAGESPLFFAEGTLMRSSGLLAFRMGAFETAVATSAPVIPVILRGTRSILRGDTWFPRWAPISVTVDPQIDTAALVEAAGGDAWRAAVRLRDLTRERILRRCGEPDMAHVRPPVFERPAAGSGQRGAAE